MFDHWTNRERYAMAMAILDAELTIGAITMDTTDNLPPGTTQADIDAELDAAEPRRPDDEAVEIAGYERILSPLGTTDVAYAFEHADIERLSCEYEDGEFQCEVRVEFTYKFTMPVQE